MTKSSPQTPTRREFLSRGASVVAGVGVATGVAVATHLEEPGDNISLEYDQAMLDLYRPRLVFPTPAREKFLGLYGWVAKSADYDTDVCCYWAEYSHQDGWLGNRDSHWGDHEPIQVEVDSESGEVQTVRASIYHWLKGEVDASSASLYDTTHPHLRVIEPWHQYTAAREGDDGRFDEVKDLNGTFEKWLDNGLEHDLEPGTTTVPWRMQNRSHWWRDNPLGFSGTAVSYGVFQSVGIDTAGSLEER